MAQRLPRKLSPKAKLRLVRAGVDERVRTLVKTAGVADPDDLVSRVTALGGTTRSWDRETGLLTVDLPAVQLGNLAELDGVVQVDADDGYGPS
ncbi:hypothetical protein SAMN05660209_05162 [Geodermatophilus africanus]|uniref:Putative peptidase inhibitor domain-containing protein n=1 Tax=Geodermatophilus africanus TaxID=1137993 RepID=A0A1H3RG22_9ACTN|nr:hypothetical protein [Geodermatophilus africanus]SDZ24590.1 hypothetical protein SAMN05660209_05162 [Geodermatophilus africanus]